MTKKIEKTNTKVTKSQAKTMIEEWLNMPYLEKTKNWNSLLPIINAHKDVYHQAVIDRKPQPKNQELST